MARSARTGWPLTRSKEGNVRVWADPWAEVIENASHRLRFVQEQLNHMVTGEDATAYLQRAYQRFLPKRSEGGAKS